MTTPTAAYGAIRIDSEGPVAPADLDYARDHLGAALAHAPGPVLHARIRLTHLADPALQSPAVAQANIDLNGRMIRAHAARPTMHEAIDEVHDRLRDQLLRAAEHWEAIRGRRPSTEPHSWRHEAVPRQQRPYFPRPAADRQIVRHKAFALPRATVDEAQFDMEMLDYGFHLFVEEGTGVDSVLHRAEDGPGYTLEQVTPTAAGLTPGATEVAVSPTPAPRLRVAEAVERLDLSGAPFVFFADAETGRGCVLYRRYDGHYGLITPAD